MADFNNSLIYEHKGYQVYATYDASADVIELFSDNEGVGYVGCADDNAEAYAIAKEWVIEQLSY